MKKTLFFIALCLVFAVPVFAQILKNPKLETDVNNSFDRGYLLIVDNQKNMVPAKFTNTDIETLIRDLKEANETITKQQKQLDEQKRRIEKLEKSLNEITKKVNHLERK